MKKIKEYGDDIFLVMTKDEIKNLGFDIDDVDDNEDEENCIDLSTATLENNEPNCFLDEGFVVDYETLQGVLHMDLYNPDNVICNESYMSREEFQNSAIRYLFDCLLAHGLLKQE